MRTVHESPIPMKKTVILAAFLLITTALRAQPPVIDSMLIDESKGVLSVYGDFGNAQGKVWCDSVELPVVSWSAALITATIPDTGKGSAGGVVVGARGDQNVERFITSWDANIRHAKIHTYSDAKSDGNIDDYHLFWRYDIHSLLRASIFRKVSLGTTNQSIYHHTYFDEHTPSSHQEFFDSSYNISISLEMKDHIYSFPIYFDDHQPIFSADSFFNLISGSIYTHPSWHISTSWASGTPKFLPPSKTIALQFNPSIIAIKTGSTNIGTDDAVLRWSALNLMEKYRVQVSKDSIVPSAHKSGQSPQSLTFVVDTVISSLDLKLLPLEMNTKYYWRVAGVNSEGQSNWSDQWNFTTGTNAAVRSASSSKLSLSIYPNPSTKGSTISFITPTRGRARLVVYDMTGRVVSTLFDAMSEGQQEILFDASQLAAGSYIVGLVCGADQVSEIVRVVR